MFGLDQMTGLVYFVFIVIMSLFVLGWIIYAIVWAVYNKKKVDLEPRKLLRKLLDDNDLKDVNIAEHKRIVKTRNFSKLSNAIVIRKNDNTDQSITQIYNIFFHFYYLYNQKTKESKAFFWLKFLSWFFVFIISLFIIDTILVILINYIKDGVVINGIELAIQISSASGIAFLIIGWFGWTNLVENYRRDLIILAKEYLSPDDYKIFKLYTSFKAFFPLSENVLCYY